MTSFQQFNLVFSDVVYFIKNTDVLANGDVIDLTATAVPFKFSPTPGLLLVGAGIGVKKGSNYLAKSKKVDLS